jgi:hypothetical protein
LPARRKPENRIGYIPTKESLYLDGLDVSDESMDELLKLERKTGLPKSNHQGSLCQLRAEDAQGAGRTARGAGRTRQQDVTSAVKQHNVNEAGRSNGAPCLFAVICTMLFRF